MSQAGELNTASGPVPPTVPERFNTDVNSPAIPAANVLNVPGGTVTTNNANGIQTDGSSGGNTLTVQLTNRIHGTVNTNGAVSAFIAVFPFNTNVGPGTYLFDFHTVAYNITDGLSAGWETQFVVRWDGALGHLVPVQDFVIIEEGAMSGVVLTFFSDGLASLNVTASGLLGKSIDWLTSGTYIYVS